MNREYASRRIASLLLALALLLAALSGGASAAGTVVTGTDLQGWIITAFNGTTSSFYDFTTPPAAPPEGTGALLMGSGPGTGPNLGGKIYVSRPDFAGQKLSAITQFSYSAYMLPANAMPWTIYANIFVDLDGNLSTTNDIAVLSFSPGDCPVNATVTRGVWETWDVVNTPGVWARYGSGAIAGWPGQCHAGTTLGTIASLLNASHPNHVIVNANPTSGEYGLDLVIGQKAGGTWQNITGYLDNVRINGTTYDFEAGGPGGGVSCRNDGRENSLCWEPWATAAVYCQAGWIDVYRIHEDGRGTLAFQTTADEIAAAGLPDFFTLLGQDEPGNIRLYRLNTGEFQLNAPLQDDPNGYAFIWPGCGF